MLHVPKADSIHPDRLTSHLKIKEALEDFWMPPYLGQTLSPAPTPQRHQQAADGPSYARLRLSPDDRRARLGCLAGQARRSQAAKVAPTQNSGAALLPRGRGLENCCFTWCMSA